MTSTLEDQQALIKVVELSVHHLEKMTEEARLRPIQWALAGLCDHWAQALRIDENDSVSQRQYPHRTAAIWPVNITMVQGDDDVQLHLHSLHQDNAGFNTGVIHLQLLTGTRRWTHRLWRWWNRRALATNRSNHGQPRRLEDMERWYWEAALPVGPHAVTRNWFELTQALLRGIDATIYTSMHVYDNTFHDVRRLGFEAFSEDGRYKLFVGLDTNYALSQTMFQMR